MRAVSFDFRPSRKVGTSVAAARNVAAFLEGSPINVVNGEHLQKK